MHNIINYSSKRMINIMKLLLQEDEGYSINKISNLLGVSVKTLIEDLKKIDSYILDIDDLFLSYKDNNSDIKTNLTFATFTIVQSKILLDSLSIRFILELINNPCREIIYYSEKLFTSNSSLYRRMVDLNIYLEKYGLKICNKGTVYFIKSDSEYEYRRFITSFLLEIYGNNIFKVINEQWFSFLEKRLKKIYKENSASIYDYYIDYYSVFYFISITREIQGYNIGYSSFFQGNDIDFVESEHDFFKKMEIELTVKELHSIESTIYINNYLLSALTKPNDILLIKDNVDLLYQQFNLEDLIDEKKYLEKIFIDIYISLSFFKVPYPFLNDRFVFFSDNIRKNHPLFYKKIKICFSNFEEKIGIDYSLYEDYLLYILVTTIPTILTYYSSKTITVISCISGEHAYFLLNQILDELRSHHIFIESNSYYSEENINYKKLEKETLLITDFKLNHDDYFFIDEYPSEDNINKIKNYLLAQG